MENTNLIKLLQSSDRSLIKLGLEYLRIKASEDKVNLHDLFGNLFIEMMLYHTEIDRFEYSCIYNIDYSVRVYKPYFDIVLDIRIADRSNSESEYAGGINMNVYLCHNHGSPIMNMVVLANSFYTDCLKYDVTKYNIKSISDKILTNLIRKTK